MADLPIIPQIEDSKPAPDVTIYNTDAVYSFGAFVLSVVQAAITDGYRLTFSLTDSLDQPVTAPFLAARGWFIEADLAPSANPENIFKLSATPPTNPGVAFFNLLFEDGVATIDITDTNSETWVLAIELNSYITLITLGAFGV